MLTEKTFFRKMKWRVWATGFLVISIWNGPSGDTKPMVTAGNFYIVGLGSDGSAVAYGKNYHGECNVDSWDSMVEVSAKYQHTAGLKSNGTVMATGYNFYGQCNTGSWVDIVDIATGYNHTVGLRSDGTVVTTGISGPQTDVSSWTGISAVAAGVDHTLGLKYDGTVVAAGYGSECDVNSWTEIVAVAAGRNFSVGLKFDGSVVATGNNSFGQCNVSSWEGIIAVAAGENHVIGLKEDGSVVAAGDNRYGQCNITYWSGIVCIEGGPDRTIGLNSNGKLLSTAMYDYYHHFNPGPWDRITSGIAGGYGFPGCNDNLWRMNKGNCIKPEKILTFLTRLVSKERISADVNTLTSFHTRSTFSPLINDVADWVKSRFSQIGYADIFDHHYTSEGYDLRNIIAMKKGCGRTGEVILICAHYDCRMEELEDGSSQAPGADDNASGVASLIELARIMAKVKTVEDVYFAAFSGEEQGFWGSAAYAQYIHDNNINLQQVINIDMIGYAPGGNSIIIEQDEGNVVESNDQPSQEFAAKMARMAADYTDLEVSFGPIYETDYMPFEALGYVCVGVYEAEENPEYHSTYDTAGSLNMSSIAEVTKMILATACHEAMKLPGIDKPICHNWGRSHFKHGKRRYGYGTLRQYGSVHW